MSGRTIVIGDVHGCLRELDLLLEHLKPGEPDRVVFLGDLVNKGPDSLGVLRRARELRACCLLGNHEARLLRYRRSGYPAVLKPGDRALLERMGDDDWALLEGMERWLELPEYQAIVVHGGFLPHLPWRDQPVEVITRIQMIDARGQPRKRSEAPNGRPWADLWNGPEFVVYGHTPRRSVFRRPCSIGIDTGCVYGGRLTAFIFPHRVLFQVKASRVYCVPRG
jgi:serine/threonine protein phosphatase 1